MHQYLSIVLQNDPAQSISIDPFRLNVNLELLVFYGVGPSLS